MQGHPGQVPAFGVAQTEPAANTTMASQRLGAVLSLNRSQEQYP
jgi:hypothetical protein